MCPCPDPATVSIQYPRGLLVAESKSVPDWTSAGVAVRLPISYQREPFRPPPTVPTPLLLTSMLCAVQSVEAPVILFLWIAAANRRSVRASSLRFEADPFTTCRMGSVVVGTVRTRFDEMAGVPPGFVIRRM